MTANPAFRLSTYLALGLACAALGAAEFPMLPEVGGFAAVVVVLLAVLYRLEGRVELLNITAANNVAIGIALAGAGWAAVRVVREVRVGEFASVGWGVFVVLLLAPVLMSLMVALLLRKEKDATVYWYVHAGGLAGVVLAAAIARRPWEIALIAAYAAAAVWALARFALVRGGAAPAAGRRAGGRAAAGWLGLAAAVVIPVFALTPAEPGWFEKFEVVAGRIEIGFNPDQPVDLTRTGELTPGADLVFTVTADEDGRPKLDLPPETRWRSRVLAHYVNGGWRREVAFRMPEVTDTAVRAERWVPPRLGPGAYQLRFSVPAELRADFLAEPVVWVPGAAVPVADVFGPNVPPRGWHPLADGSFLRQLGRPNRSPTLEYVQHTAPLPDPDLGVAFLLSGHPDRALTENPVPAVQTFSRRLLARLVTEGKLPPAAGAVDARTARPPEDQHEAVARAFTRYLSEAPDYAYSLTLTRSRPDLDPVEDFLEHTKTGHCERFASALVLMLRSQGIPTALVTGFKGHTLVGDGRYEVYQDRAHAWATALVSRPDAGGGRVWHWLSLDPSPAVGDTPAAAGAGQTAAWDWVWDKFLDATPEERLAALGQLAASPVAVGVVVGLVVLAALGWGARRIVRARAAAGPGNTWLEPLFAVLHRHGFVPAAGETPREFAERVSVALTAHPGTTAVAAIPAAWVEAYYEKRFGGAAPTADRRAALDAGLAALRAALAETPTGGTR